MPDDTAHLARRDGVELIRTGTWRISTGTWRASRQDIAAAVAALACPAISKPIIKIGHTDKRFTPGDGEPAIGWYENLRATDGGHTLVGDQVAPSWLTGVQAAAWPNRSVEGTYNYVCGLGHTHPFVLTAVALLGVTPPGVSTLSSLHDVKALYGVAATAHQPSEGEVRIVASVQAAVGDTSTGAMVALIPSDADAGRLAIDGGEPASELHVTLLYLGEAAGFTVKAQAAVIDAVRRATVDTPTVEAHAFAASVFNPSGTTTPDGRDRDTCLVLGVSGDDLEYVQALAASAARKAALQFAVDVPEQHRPWVPHLTLAYSDDLTRLRALADRTGPVTFDRVRVAFAGQHTDIPLTAVEPLDFGLPGPMMPVAAAGDGKLRDYWLRGEGAAKIRWGTGGDFTRCVRHLRKYVADPKGLCAEYHHEATGMWPGDRRNVHASQEGTPMPNPTPGLVERIHRAWNASDPPEQQWIVEAAEDEVIVMDNTDRSLVRVPVTVDGGDIRFGSPQRVRPAYVPAEEPVDASRMVFASCDESRPDVHVAAGIDGDAVEAHLRGRHDQSKHGNRFNKSGDRGSGLRHVGRERGGKSGTSSSGRDATGNGADGGGKWHVGIPSPTQARESPADAVKTAQISQGIIKDDRGLRLAERRFLHSGDKNRAEAENAWRKERAAAFAHSADRAAATAVAALPTSQKDAAAEDPNVRQAVDAYAEVVRENSAPTTFDNAGAEEVKRRDAAEAAAKNNIQKVISERLASRLDRGTTSKSGRDAYLKNLPAVDEDGIRAVADKQVPPVDRHLTGDARKAAEEARKAEVDAVAAAATRRALVRREESMRGLRRNATEDGATPEQLAAIDAERKRVLDASFAQLDRVKEANARRDKTAKDRDAAVKQQDDADRAEVAAVMRSLVSKIEPEADIDAAGRAAEKAIRKELGLPSATRSKQLSRSRDNQQRQTGYIAGSLAHNAANVAELRTQVEYAQRQLQAVQNLVDRIRPGQMSPGAELLLRRALDSARANVRQGESALATAQRELADSRRRWQEFQQGGDITASATDFMPEDDLIVFAPYDIFADFIGDDVAELPAAEPEHAPSTEPKEGEGTVSTLSTDVRSRLGLPEDADDNAIMAALDDLQAKAANQPDTEQVAASAKAENNELRKEVQVLASQVQTMSAKLAAAEAEKTATVKASVLDEAQRLGKFTPADREKWDRDYDDAPGVVTRVLASIADGAAVPVIPAGYTGTTDDTRDLDTEWAAVASIFPPSHIGGGN